MGRFRPTKRSCEGDSVTLELDGSYFTTEMCEKASIPRIVLICVKKVSDIG